jgi:hypothetical protein
MTRTIERPHIKPPLAVYLLRRNIQATNSPSWA